MDSATLTRWGRPLGLALAALSVMLLSGSAAYATIEGVQFEVQFRDKPRGMTLREQARTYRFVR